MEVRTVLAAFKYLRIGSHTELDTCSHELLLTITDNLNSQIIDYSSRITLHSKVSNFTVFRAPGKKKRAPAEEGYENNPRDIE